MCRAHKAYYNHHTHNERADLRHTFRRPGRRAAGDPDRTSSFQVPELAVPKMGTTKVPKMGTLIFYDAGDAGQTKTGNCHLLQNGYKTHKTRSFYV